MIECHSILEWVISHKFWWKHVTDRPLRLLCLSKRGHHRNGDWAAQRQHILCPIRSAHTHLGLWPSLHNQPMYPNMCFIDIFINLQQIGWNMKGDSSTPGLGVRGTWGRGWANLIARPWVPIGSQVTHTVNSYRFLSYLAGSRSVSAHPSDPDTMKISLHQLSLHWAANTTLKSTGTDTLRDFGQSSRTRLNRTNPWHKRDRRRVCEHYCLCLVRVLCQVDRLSLAGCEWQQEM